MKQALFALSMLAILAVGVAAAAIDGAPTAQTVKVAGDAPVTAPAIGTWDPVLHCVIAIGTCMPIKPQG